MSLDRYDSIVVGSGISGLTMTLILALAGNSVLLIEKAAAIGGSLKRFSRGGMLFDVGLHFTGGMEDGGVFRQCLKALGLLDRLDPISFDEDNTITISYIEEDKSYTLPCCTERLIETLIGYFPAEEGAVRKYFQMVGDVCVNTPSMDIRFVGTPQPRLDEDFISLGDVLKALTKNQLLRAVLATHSMCYGVKPSEVSFANHARIVQMLYDSQCTFKGGGDAIIDVFLEKFRELDVQVRTETEITGFKDIRDGIVGRLALSDGTEVASENCIFTMHPFKILELLPREHFRKVFFRRVKSFEPSVGFFTIFGSVLEDSIDTLKKPEMLSLFPNVGEDGLLGHEGPGWRGLTLLKAASEGREENRRPIYIFEPVGLEETSLWHDTVSGHRPEGYYRYKQAKVERALERVYAQLSGLKDKLNVACSASVLTYRDFLNSPDGTAYGIKQKMHQFNLLGKLRLKNLFVAGQSSLLPGVAGAMMSSFVVASRILGDDKYSQFLARHCEA